MSALIGWLAEWVFCSSDDHLMTEDGVRISQMSALALGIIDRFCGGT